MYPFFMSHSDDLVRTLVNKKLDEAISSPEIMKLIEDQLDLYIKEKLSEHVKNIVNNQIRNIISNLFYDGKPNFLAIKNRVEKHVAELPELDSIISQEVQKVTADSEFFRSKIRDEFKTQLSKLIEEVSEKVEQRRLTRKIKAKKK